MPGDSRGRPIRIGILDHTGSSLGGGQLVAGHLATILSRHYHVELIHDGKVYSLGTIASAFGLDLSKVKERIIAGLPDGFGIPGGHPFFQQIRTARILTRPYDLFIYCGLGVPPFCHAGRGLVYCHFPVESSPDKELETGSQWLRRNPLDRFIRGSAYKLLWQIRMDGYSTIMANSYFTARWIKHRWGRPAEVVYPPVELLVPQVKKLNLIVSVGRFVGRGRSKHQLKQISTFREFLTKVSGAWGLCLIGSCGSAAEDQTYLSAVQEDAQGLPVTLLVNQEQSVICRWLAEAKIFWHTTGLYVDETESPDHAEHFGIATVESMRAGCVPIVIASGGQIEIVENGVNGFLCKDLDALIRNTVALASDDGLLSALSQRARQSSMAFAKEAFERRVTDIVSQCLN